MAPTNPRNSETEDKGKLQRPEKAWVIISILTTHQRIISGSLLYKIRMRRMIRRKNVLPAAMPLEMPFVSSESFKKSPISTSRYYTPRWLPSLIDQRLGPLKHHPSPLAP
jgi:hypothetical protein